MQEENNNLRISYGTLYKAGFLIILLIVIVMLFKNFDSVEATGNSITSINDNSNKIAGNVQLAKMEVIDGQYVIEPNSFKVGIPVRIESDINKIPGCAKNVVIPAFNVKENLNENNKIIEFTPNKAGTFNIMCSMNMYRGTFTVLQGDGTKANYVEKASTAGATCGSNGGGCGCGG